MESPILDYRDELEGLTDAFAESMWGLIITIIAITTLILISTIITIGFFEEIV